MTTADDFPKDMTQAAPPADAADTGEQTEEQQLWNELAQQDANSPASDDASDDAETPDAAPSDGASGEKHPPEASAKTDDVDLAAQLTRLQSEIAERDQALKSERGRTSALTKKANGLQRDIAELTAQLKQAQEGISLDTKDKISKVRGEYGDVVGPLADALEAVDKQVQANSKITERQIAEKRSELKGIYEEQRQVFLDEHGDGFDTIVKNRAKFDAWIEDQPKVTRDAYLANRDAITDGKQAALIVADFKSFLQGGSVDSARAADPLRGVRERQMAGSKSSTGTAARPVANGRSPQDSEDPDVIWAQLREQEARTTRR